MRRTLRLTALAGAAATVAALCPARRRRRRRLRARRRPRRRTAAGHSVVYVQTNDPTGNQVVTYVSDGRGLHEVGRTDTGGLGVAIPGAAVDKLASQGGLAADPADGLLVGVNGGSNTISVFHTFGPFVSRPRVVVLRRHHAGQRGRAGRPVYVLNAGGTGSIQGFYARLADADPGQQPVARPHPGR